MTEEITIPIITEEDVLNGFKTFQVELRKGGVKSLTVIAPNWRTSLRLVNMGMTDPAEAAIYGIQNCLSAEQGKEEFLNAIIPAHLSWVSHVAMLLGNGVEDAKKRQAKESKAPASKTTLPPNAV